jgi:hypothetical protein
MKYNVDYFIKKFEAIPEEKWATQDFSNGDRHCANGHCGVYWHGASINQTPESRSLQKVLSPLTVTNGLELVKDGRYEIFGPEYSLKAAIINNGDANEYQRPTPKQRILAALYDIKKAQQPEVKERIVYVTVDAPVRDLQKKELSLQ